MKKLNKKRPFPRKKGKSKKHTSNRGKCKHYEGKIFITNSAMGYIKHEEFEEQIEIETHLLSKAFHLDTVEFCLLPHKKGERQKGEVLKVKERFKTTFVGTIERKNPKDSFAFLIPDDQRLYRDFFIPNAGKKVKHGYKVMVELEKWKDSKNNPTGKVIKIIGKKGDINVEMHSIVYANSLYVDFPKKVLEQANEIKKNAANILKEELKTRKDMRDTLTLTIDPFDAKDFDDALSFKELEKGLYEIGIHIADVTAYLKKGTPMDKEAKKRAFTIYLVDRTIPMLPEVLSNDLCSLNPHQDKLAYSAVFKIDQNGNIKDRWFGRTVIHSDHRFTYKEAQKVIDNKKGKYADELITLNNISKIYQRNKLKRGAINFDRNEVEFILDKKGHPTDVHTKEPLETHKLIEEFMVLANKEVAKYLSLGNKDKEFSCLFRVHDIPKEGSADSFLNILGELGHSLELDKEGKISSKGLNKLLGQVKDKPEEGLVNNLLLRSMSKAKYSAKNIGHYGLALENYAHFTSPIRRYADVTVHQVLTKKLSKQKLSKEEKKKYSELGEQLSETELRVKQAEFTSIELKQTEYMLDHVGEVFEGVITGITKFGIFVEITETQAEGLVHIKELKNDFYEMDEHMYYLEGRETGEKYRLGDKITVKILGGNIEKKNVDLALAEKEEETKTE